MFDTLENRMKGYEKQTNFKLVSGVPVIGRVDGKNFSKFTKSLKKEANSPWNEKFVLAMAVGAIVGCQEIQGCKMAYVQSDEISFLITDTESEQTQPYFGYKTRKMNSVIASAVAVEFYAALVMSDPSLADSRPKFDSRFWNLPEHEVVNAFVWRQQDALRNSVSMYARHYFSHKECNGRTVLQMKEMLRNNGTPWEDVPSHFQKGFTVTRKSFEEPVTFMKHGAKETVIAKRNRWTIDWEIPLFKEDREYVSRFL